MKTLPLIATALLVATAAHAQERSAGQTYDAQTNWSALSGKIDAVINQNKLLATTIDKMNACNAKKMVYAPADAKADAGGCVNTTPGIDYTACTDINWVHSNTNLYCPAGSVMVAGKSRRSDSGEWNGMICCPLGTARGAPPAPPAPPPPSSGGGVVFTGGCSGGGDQDCTYHPYAGSGSNGTGNSNGGR